MLKRQYRTQIVQKQARLFPVTPILDTGQCGKTTSPGTGQKLGRRIQIRRFTDPEKVDDQLPGGFVARTHVDCLPRQQTLKLHEKITILPLTQIGDEWEYDK